MASDAAMNRRDFVFFILDKSGQHAGVAMYGSGEKTFALCTDNGAEAPTLEPLLAADPAD